MAILITQWLGPNNFTVLRDKFNAVVLALTGGTTGQVLVKKSADAGDFDFKSIMDLMPTGQEWKTYQKNLALPPFNGNWVKLDGKTLGNLSSTADYKGDLYKNLFIFLWENIDDTVLPVSSGRGIDALSDYNANKKIPLLDTRGVMDIGYDERVTDPSNGIWDISYSTMGKLFGEKAHTLTPDETAQKALSSSLGKVWNGVTYFGDVPGGGGTDVPTTSGFVDAGVNISASNASAAHNNIPPIRSSNKIMKL